MITFLTVPQYLTMRCIADWAPFAERIALSEDMPLATVIDEIASGDAVLHLIYDGRTAYGAVTTRTLMRLEGEKIGEVYWLCGDGLKSWLSVLTDGLDEYFIRTGCAGTQTFAREGLERLLKSAGWHRTKVVLEKRYPANGGD